MCQATYLGSRGKNTYEEDSNKKPLKGKDKGKGGKWKGKKTANVKKEGEKITCKHYSKDGHDETHYWKLHPEMRPSKFNNKGKQKTTAITQEDLGSEWGDEDKITVMGIKGKQDIARTSSQNRNITTTLDEKRWTELFHVKVTYKDTKIDTLFDSGSQTNIIFEDLVKRLNLETGPHHKPYTLGSITRDTSLHLTRKCLFKFEITANFIDEVELDVVQLDILGVVLGSPYLYDWKSVFYHHENKYHLFKDGVEYIVRACRKKLNISLVNAGEAKRLVNSSKSLVLLMFKPNDDIVYENVVMQVSLLIWLV